MPKPIIQLHLEGEKYGRLTVISEAPRRGTNRRWNCICECGKQTTVRQGDLRGGKTRSCGCLQPEAARHCQTKHNSRGDDLYQLWCGMRARCNYPKHIKYSAYGGRGIYVCERWNHFEHFKSDMGPRPTAKHQIDRIDNDGPYSPENCRWVTSDEQSLNKRNTTRCTFNNETLPLVKWAKQVGLKPQTIYSRITRGWSVEKALTTPPASRDKPERRKKARQQQS